MATKVILRREVPPPVKPRGCGKGRASKWPAVFAAIAAGRGSWVRVGEFKNANSAGAAARTAVQRHDDGRFEFTSRTIDGVGVLYARLRTEGGK